MAGKSEGDARSAESRTLDERGWESVPARKTYRARYARIVPGLHGNGCSESSDIPSGRPCWRCENERASAAWDAEEQASFTQRSAEKGSSEGAILWVMAAVLGLIIVLAMWSMLR